MNIKRAKEEIKNTIEAYLYRDAYGSYAIPAIRQRPVLLIGPPGVGKTQIMEQVAQECCIGLVSYTITHHTRQSAIGLPYIQERRYNGEAYSITEYTMSEIVASVYDKIESTGLREGILFIDEINCVSETLAPAMLQFLQCKTFGNRSIPEGWVIVAAGNPPEYNKSVREFDIVTLDRIKLIYVEADFAVWKEYADRAGIHPAVVSYLEVKKQHFCQIETTVDGKIFATPRGWEDLSRLIEVYEKLGKTIDREVVFQYIQHAKIAKDFANYLELYYKYQNDYQVEEILGGIIRESVCDHLARAPFDERLSVMSLLSARLNSQFQEVAEQEDVLEHLQKELQKVKPEHEDQEERGEHEKNGEHPVSGLGLVTFDNALDQLEAVTAGVVVEHRHRMEAKLLNRRDDYRYRKVITALESFVQTLKAEGVREHPEVWNRLKELFGEKSNQYEELFEQTGTMLEHGFDFMEAAFGDSQEMVVFLTGLNTGYYSIPFLQEYPCERYYQYNERLLFDNREQEMAERIDRALR